MGPARSVSPRLRTPHAYARLLSCQLECSPDMRRAAEHVTVRASDGGYILHNIAYGALRDMVPIRRTSAATPIARGNTPLTIPILYRPLSVSHCDLATAEASVASIAYTQLGPVVTESMMVMLLLIDLI